MDRNEVFEKLKGILADKLTVEESIIEPTSNIIEDLEADSLDIVDMLMEIESEFGVTIPDDKIEDLKTVNDVIDYIVV